MSEEDPGSNPTEPVDPVDETDETDETDDNPPAEEAVASADETVAGQPATGNAAPTAPTTGPAPRRRVGALVGAAALAVAALGGSFALGRASADDGYGGRHHMGFGPGQEAGPWNGPFNHDGRGDKGDWGPGRDFPNFPGSPDGRHHDRNDGNGKSKDSKDKGSTDSNSSGSDYSNGT